VKAQVLFCNKVSLEGALGKISVTTARNPKRAFGASFGVGAEAATKVFTDSEKILAASVLGSVEKAYNTVLALEQLNRQVPSEQEEMEEWQKKIGSTKAKLFTALHVADKVAVTYP
jgi:Topoisomerase II-associated protein PAT1